MYTTLDKLKLHLGIEFSDESKDELLEYLIEDSTKDIENECGRSFERNTFTEYFCGNGSQVIYLKNRPVISITSVTINSGESGSLNTLIETIAASNCDIVDTAAIFYSGGFPDGRALEEGIVGKYPDPSKTSRNITITYVGGYILPGEEDSDFPADLEGACIELCKHKYPYSVQNRNVVSEQIADYKVQYGKSTEYEKDGIPIRVMRILKRYKGAVI